VRVLILFFAVFFSLPQISKGQDYVLNGYVSDSSSGERLIGSTIQVLDGGNSVSTNSYGYFSLSIPKGEVTVLVSHVGYEVELKTLSLHSDQRLDVELTRQSKVLDEVVISNQREQSILRSPQMGQTKLQIEELKNIPVIFGERDVLKTIQLLPGVTSGGEGSTDFYVRGGGGDQNLILLDEATVYNTSHLLGFFSTFNSDAIKDVSLYKGGIPAQFGGRASSVMDVKMLEGNKKDLRGEGGIGLIASRLKLEGPLKKGKSSFMLSGRRTYADLFLKLSKDKDINESSLYFYDFNTKLNFELDDRNTLFVSGYFGRDAMSYSDLFSFDWGNRTATMRWNHIFNQKIFSNTSLIYSDFTYNVDVQASNADFEISSVIQNLNFKQDFDYYTSSNNKLKFGLHFLYRNVNPASISARENTGVNDLGIESRRGIELDGYASYEWKWNERISTITGLRINNFIALGPGTFYGFDADGIRESEETYRSSDIVKHYLNLEPRWSMRYLLNAQSSIKASYNRVTQNLHKLTNTTSSLPTDQYVISSKNVKPQVVDQVSAGYFRHVFGERYELSIESYYKWMQNQIDFRNGADLQANVYLEGELLYGKGRSYGLEWILEKNKGRLSGWLSYTLSKSERQIDPINNGNWYNARQDRTHDLSLVLMYQLSEKWTLGSAFTYFTGNAVTFPRGKYEIENQTMYYYTDRNADRMPDYHRWDLSATYEPKNDHKKWHSSWSFGVYNAYNRKNAYLIDFRENEINKNQIDTYRVALFGIIPSVTWNFKF